MWIYESLYIINILDLKCNIYDGRVYIMKKVSINQNITIVIKSLIVTIIAICVLELMLSLMRNVGLNIPNDSLAGNVLLEITILIVQCLIIRKYCKGQFLGSIGLSYDEDSIKYVSKGVCVGLIGTILIYLTIFLMKIGFYEGTGFKFYESKVVLSFIISMFIRAFFAGVCEEVFFRGILLNYLAKYKGKTFGLLVSSLIFTVFHCSRYTDIYQLSSVLLCGISLGYLYIITKSLYMPIGLHFATDFFMNLVSLKDQPSLLILDINSRFSVDYLTQTLFILLGVSYVILILILFLIDKISYKKDNTQ